MNTEELLKLHETICDDARSIMRAKNADYSGASGDPFANFRGSTALGIDPVLGILLRCQDKFQRIRAFAAKGELQVKDEPVDDAIRDVVNYMVLLAGLVNEKRQSNPGDTSVIDWHAECANY